MCIYVLYVNVYIYIERERARDRERERCMYMCILAQGKKRDTSAQASSGGG